MNDLETVSSVCSFFFIKDVTPLIRPSANTFNPSKKIRGKQKLCQPGPSAG